MFSQKQKLLDLLKDGQAHRTDEILAVVYGSNHLGLARIGARILELKKDGYVFEKGRKEGTLYWYQLKTIPYAEEKISPSLKENSGQAVQPIHQTERQGSLFHLPSSQAH